MTWRRCALDFIVTFQRGAEWVATGSVTLTVPPGFPDADTVRTRELATRLRPGDVAGAEV